MPRGKLKKKAEKEPKKDEKTLVEVPKTPEIDENLVQKEEKEPEIKLEPQLEPEPRETPKPIEPEPEPPLENNGIVLDKELYSLDEAARFLGIQSITAKLWFEHGHLTGIDDRGLKMASKESILAVQGSKLMDSKR